MKYLIDIEENIIVEPVEIELIEKNDLWIARFLCEKANYTVILQAKTEVEALTEIENKKA
jgi:hypothetical protein